MCKCNVCDDRVRVCDTVCVCVCVCVRCVCKVHIPEVTILSAYMCQCLLDKCLYTQHMQVLVREVLVRMLVSLINTLMYKQYLFLYRVYLWY